MTDAFGEEAAAYVRRHKAGPFFIYLAFNAPHVPLQATEKYLKRFPHLRGARRTYAAMVSAMDDAVRRVLFALREEGLEGDTLIFFLSDNGGHPLANATRNGPLRGEKGTVYEGGIRVPFVVRWTGRLPAGARYAHPVVSLDVMAPACARLSPRPARIPRRHRSRRPRTLSSPSRPKRTGPSVPSAGNPGTPNTNANLFLPNRSPFSRSTF
jgi:arylsulfatase A-like enzyme